MTTVNRITLAPRLLRDQTGQLQIDSAVHTAFLERMSLPFADLKQIFSHPQTITYLQKRRGESYWVDFTQDKGRQGQTLDFDPDIVHLNTFSSPLRHQLGWDWAERRVTINKCFGSSNSELDIGGEVDSELLKELKERGSGIIEHADELKVENLGEFDSLIDQGFYKTSSPITEVELPHTPYLRKRYCFVQSTTYNKIYPGHPSLSQTLEIEKVVHPKNDQRVDLELLIQWQSIEMTIIQSIGLKSAGVRWFMTHNEIRLDHEEDEESWGDTLATPRDSQLVLV